MCNQTNITANGLGLATLYRAAESEKAYGCVPKGIMADYCHTYSRRQRKDATVWIPKSLIKGDPEIEWDDNYRYYEMTLIAPTWLLDRNSIPYSDWEE